MEIPFKGNSPCRFGLMWANLILSRKISSISDLFGRLDEDWGAWKIKVYSEFSNLPFGTYTFLGPKPKIPLAPFR